MDPGWRRLAMNCSASLESRSGHLALDLAVRLPRSRCSRNCSAKGLTVDILVNNAGYGKFGEFAEVTLEESVGQIQLNVTALT